MKLNFVAVVSFPEYAELAALLNEEAQTLFLSDFRKAIETGLGPRPANVDITTEAFARIDFAADEKLTPQVLLATVNEIYKECQLWTGTFGRTGIPHPKYGFGVATNFEEASALATQFCQKFDLRLGVSGEIVRVSLELANWIDYDDIDVSGKVIRAFSRIPDRVDPEDLRMLRSARKAYTLQNWPEASEKFDRLTRVPEFKHMAKIFLNRIVKLGQRPKDINWDLVYRKETR